MIQLSVSCAAVVMFDDRLITYQTVEELSSVGTDAFVIVTGSIEGQRTCLVFALAQQLLQMERHGIRSGLAGRDGYPLVGKRIVFRIEHRPRGVVTGVVGIDERWIDCNGDRDVATGRISQRCGECPIEFIERVFDRCRLHVSRFRHVEVDHITELVVVGIIGLTGAESGRSDQP